MAGQTAESNGLNFNEETNRYPCFFVLIRFLKFHGQRLALQLVCNTKKRLQNSGEMIKVN